MEVGARNAEQMRKFEARSVRPRAARETRPEVNGWRYPSVWARVPALHAAVQTTTPSGAPRGFVVVSQSAGTQPVFLHHV